MCNSATIPVWKINVLRDGWQSTIINICGSLLWWQPTPTSKAKLSICGLELLGVCIDRGNSTLMTQPNHLKLIICFRNLISASWVCHAEPLLDIVFAIYATSWTMNPLLHPSFLLNALSLGKTYPPASRFAPRERGEREIACLRDIFSTTYS